MTRWSTPFGFNMRWTAEPEQILPDTPGLVRWTPVEGATSYEVWFVDPGKVIRTSTNVADEREYYSFHSDPLWSGTVQWRVRAVRTLYGVAAERAAGRHVRAVEPDLRLDATRR